MPVKEPLSPTLPDIQKPLRGTAPSVPRISVVIPTYGRPFLLRRCLAALYRQDLDHGAYEVIVVTDGPDAATADLVHRHFPLAQVYHTAVRRGPAAARNLGWQHAGADLIAFTDDDTIPDTSWLSQFVQAYHYQSQVAFTGRTIVPLSDEPTDYELNTFGLEQAEFITANCCCTRDALLEVNGFDERFSMAWREDSDLHFKLIRAGISILSVHTAIVVHPVRKATWGVSILEQKKGIYNPLLFKKHPELYRERIQTAPLWNYYGMLLALLLLAFSPALHNQALTIGAFTVWVLLFINFVYRRLKNTKRSFSHVSEMLVTSAVIPVTSLYWQFYGSLKFRKLLL